MWLYDCTRRIAASAEDRHDSIFETYDIDPSHPSRHLFNLNYSYSHACSVLRGGSGTHTGTGSFMKEGGSLNTALSRTIAMDFFLNKGLCGILSAKLVEKNVNKR